MPRRYVKYVYSNELIQEADSHPAFKGRASLTHDLIVCYDLLPHMMQLWPHLCHPKNLHYFHTREYVRQLERFSARVSTKVDSSGDDDEFDPLSPSIVENFGLGYDCPTWPRLKQYACHVGGATMTACMTLVNRYCATNMSEIIINWTGGWHHAQIAKAAGFCYVNDIALGITILRSRFKRILYLDLDVHHGDGVQAAFEKTKRVFTVSFHKYECGFYPGSGGVKDCGFGIARGYTVNFPYKNGISGPKFRKYFHRIMSQVLELYKPDACVVQCGADALVGDPLGGTNLTPDDLIDCVNLIVRQELPMLVLGGGGYNFTNASRFWTKLTAALVGRKLCDDIPVKCVKFLDYGPDYSLSIEAQKHLKDSNTESYLESCAKIIEGNLKNYCVFAFE